MSGLSDGRRRALASLLIGAAATAAALAITGLPPTLQLLETVELTTLDWRVRSTATPARDDSRVVLVLFDSTSIREFPYLSPFPRARLAEIVDLVAGSGADAIALDVYLDRRYPELELLDSGEVKLRTALERAGNVVLVAETRARPGDRQLLPPDPYFAGVAAAVGAADLPTPHEVIRDALLVARTDSAAVPGVALALYALASGADPAKLARRVADGEPAATPSLPAAFRTSPDSPVRSAPLRFIGPPSVVGSPGGAFPAYSASALLALGESVPPEWFRDRIVLIGSGFHPEDRFRSPFYGARLTGGGSAGWTYGTEVHATALHNLLEGGYPTPLTPGLRIGLLFLLALATAAGIIQRGLRVGIPVAIASLVLLLAAAWHLFDRAAVSLPVTASVTVILLAAGGATSWSAAFEGRRARMVRRAFSRYLSPAIVDLLVADPSLLKLGGERRDLSVLFSDLAGFTTLSEHTDPERLVALLSEYLDEMAGLVISHGGTLDKYVGDAVMALFGAPLSQRDHAQRACRTALSMQRRLRELNLGWVRQGWPPLQVRIGVHSGRPLVGNIGGEHRFDYTAIGDDVNLAARLETACKDFEVGIVISENTRRSAGAAIQVRELGLLVAKGRNAPVRVYELLGMAGDAALAEPALTVEPLPLAARLESDSSLTAAHPLP